jgi:hypothetical protein
MSTTLMVSNTFASHIQEKIRAGYQQSSIYDLVQDIQNDMLIHRHQLHNPLESYPIVSNAAPNEWKFQSWLGKWIFGTEKKG